MAKATKTKAAKVKESKFQLPPEPEQKSDNVQKLQEFIGEGGKVKSENEPAPAAPEAIPEAFKNFNIKILESQWEKINALREKLPKPAGQKSPGISLHNWILEAITEKIAKG